MNLLTAKQKFKFQILGTSFDTEVVEFTMEEGLSTPYRAKLILACEESITLADVLGKEALLTLRGDPQDRWVHGMIQRFAQNGKRGRFILYEAHLVPQLWLLSQKQDSRIFQNQSIRDILPEILSDVQISGDRLALRLQETYSAKDYGVQYQETDLAFLSRLLESEGIWYGFEHTREKYTVLFADSRSAYQPIAGEASLTFKQGKGLSPQDEVVYQFSMSREIVPGKVSHTDFNYSTPSVPLASDQQSSENSRLEIYEYPGRYEDADGGQRLAKIRLQERTSMQETGEGSSTSVRLAPGYVFRLKGHPTPAFNRDYLIVSVKHNGDQPQVLEETSAPGAMSYSNEFTVIPADQTFRPARQTPKPVIQGPQTAVVMGPEGEEIYTDEQGRVKVRFHWDRGQDKNEKSSCWIRVSQLWAGEGWGAMFLPRRGQEVIVSFLDGDPDRPIITGRVYNGANPTPTTVQEKTKSTIITRSTDGGTGSNELSFEDKQGAEEIYLHAQKNLRIAVENDKREDIGNDESRTIQKHQSTDIGGQKTETVVQTSTENVGAAKLTNVGGAYGINVGMAHAVTVAGAMNTAVGLSQTEEVGLSKQAFIGHDLKTTVGKDTLLDVSGHCETNAGKTVIIQAGESFEVICGQSSFKLDKDGTVTLTGTQFKMQASGPIRINGETVDIN